MSQIGTCDDCKEEIPEGDVYTCRSLSREVERGGAIDVLHAEPTSILCSRCSSFRGCGEAEAEPQEEADPVPPDLPPTRYPPARHLEWEDWVNTHSQCDEWTRWDTADAWFLTVDRTDGWHWLAAYAPGDGNSLAEQEGVGASKASAMAQAAAWAEHHALHPSLLAALLSTSSTGGNENRSTYTEGSPDSGTAAPVARPTSPTAPHSAMLEAIEAVPDLHARCRGKYVVYDPRSLVVIEAHDDVDGALKAAAAWADDRGGLPHVVRVPAPKTEDEVPSTTTAENAVRRLAQLVEHFEADENDADSEDLVLDLTSILDDLDTFVRDVTRSRF